MLWMFESKEYAVILAASFLAGLLMDMILKKVTKQGETKYTAFLSVCITAVFLGTYGTNEHALVCTLFGQMLLYASEYDLTTHTVPDYVHVLLLLIGLLEIQFFRHCWDLYLCRCHSWQRPFSKKEAWEAQTSSSWQPVDLLWACRKDIWQ